MSKVNTGQASSTLIPKYIGSDFDKVVAVADNIEQVVVVSDNIEDVGTVADNINYVKEVAEDLHGMPVTMYTGENPPVLNPMPEGVMWYCTTDGRTYVWYTDADSGQWVESAPQSAMKDEATNIFFHATPSNVNAAYRNATLFSTPAPEAEISVAHNALNTPVVHAQFIREEALWVDVSVTGAQGIVTLMGYSSGSSQLKAEIIAWKNGAEGTSLGTSQWVTLPSQPSVISLPVTLANIDVLDAGDSYVVRLTSQMNAGGSAVSTILVDGNTSSRFGIIFNTSLIGLNDGIRDGVTTSAPTENAVYDALQLKAAKTEVSDALQLKVGKSQLVQSGNLTSTANWADVPAYSDSELGGSGGPLNAQAKALTARSELLLTDVRESLRRSYAEAGYNLVDGSFEAGGTLVNANDVLLQERTGKAFSGTAGTVTAGTNPAGGGFVDRSGVVASHVLLESFGYGFAANTPAQNYEALQKFYAWLATQASVGTIIHPPRRVDIQTTVTANNTKFLGTDITALKSFIFDFNGGQMNDLTDVSASNAQHVIFVIRNADVVSFINSDVAGSMGDPTSVRGGMTLCRAYNSGYVSFKGKAAGIINHVETRDCGTLEVAAECDTVRYPFLVYRCKSFDVTLNNKNCWRDYFIQGAETGQFHIVSDAPRQHSMLKSYDSAMVNSNIVGYYKARNRTYALESPTGQFGFEIESDEQAIFRNIHITVDIEGNYGRPIMMRNYKANGSDQDAAKGHVFQNIKISGRIRDRSGTTGNLFLVGGGYRAGDFIQSMALDDLTVSGSFVVNVAQMLPAIDAASKMKWRNFTITDGYLESHVTGFYADYISAHNVTFVGKAYSSNNPQSLGSLEFSKRFVGNIVTGIPLFTLDTTRTMNHVVIDYCATATDTSFNPFIEGRLSGLLVYPTSGVVSETTVDTQYAKQGTAGVADLFEVSPGVLGIKIPTWSATAAMLQVRVMVKYHSYGEGDFSSIPGMIYAPYKSM